jgi:hypothetical protein
MAGRAAKPPETAGKPCGSRETRRGIGAQRYLKRVVRGRSGPQVLASMRAKIISVTRAPLSNR